jgi:hypothetical protein
LVVLVGVSFTVPLVYWFGVAGLPTWGIPFSALLVVQGGAAAARGKIRFRKIDGFEWAVLVFVVTMALSTLMNPSEDPLGANKLFVFFLALSLAIYVKRNYGRTVDIQHLVYFAYFFVIVQFVVCILQYVTQSAIGDVSAYFGTTTVQDLETGLKQAALGIGRVVGTVGTTNLLGRAIVVLLPFVAISDRVFPKLKDHPLHYVGKRVVIAMGGGVVLLTVSRSSIAVLALLALVVGIQRLVCGSPFRDWGYTTRWRLASSTLLVLLVSLGGYAALSNPGFREKVSIGAEVVELRIERAIEREAASAWSAPGPLEIRYRLGIGAVELFAESPVVLGAGYRNTKRLPQKTSISGIPNPNLRVHNAHLQFLAEGGLFAFIAFLTITLYPIVRLVRGGRRRDPVRWAFFASTASMLIFMQTSTTYDTAALAPVYMLILGSALGYADRSTAK